MSTNAVELINIHKYFGAHKVLEDLNLRVVQGKITSLLGFSGSGKSTIMKIILGLISPTKGQVKVLGEDIANFSDDQLRHFRQNFGMVFQYAALFDSLSTFENIAFPMREFTDSGEEEIEKNVESLIQSVGLEKSSLDKLPSELSGGMRKRVGLARALALRPKIMLYDEPTTGLDPITTKMVNDLIYSTAHQFKGSGLTSLIISHDVKATLSISDFVAFLDHGRIIEYLPVDDFTKSENPKVRGFLDL